MARTRLAHFAVWVALLGASQGQCGAIAFDPFPIGAGAYTNNVDLNVQGPTNTPVAGFTNVWIGATSLAESSTTPADAPCALESGGSCRFAGNADTMMRTVYRDFIQRPCAHGDTNYWSVIVSLDGQDADDTAYVTWRDTAAGATYMALNLGIKNGRLFARLREQVLLDLGSYIPGKAYHLVARAVISGGDPADKAYEGTTVWVNPTRSDILHDHRVAARYTTISFISPGYDHDRAEISTQNIGGRTAFFDELLYTADIDDLKLSLQKIQSATFTPMPRPDDSGMHIHMITHDFGLDSITLADGRHPDIEGPTNAWATCSYVNKPANGRTVSAAEALSGLGVNFAGNIATAEVIFATAVTNGFPGGFFLVEINGDDYDFVITPLDENRAPIGNWSLTIAGNTPWGTNLTGEGKSALDIQYDVGPGKINGMAFTLDDFTGGSGVLTGVKGLRFVDPSPSFDLDVVGIYHSPTQALAYGTAALPMTGATFSRTLDDNPITNDFQLTGISTALRAWDTVEGAVTANIHVTSETILVYPQNGNVPASPSAALRGLDMNGALNTGCHMEFMFATPIADPGDCIFVIDDITYDYNPITVRPLDQNRFPISTHSLRIKAGDWGGTLTANTITYQNWGGTSTGRRVGGVAFRLSDFAGGASPLERLWGIRIEDPEGGVDLMMVGRRKASGTLFMLY
ncbi:MAG TPA: hypothetical protein PKM57_08445 [Kiritimatiellia bacterium]|nr:hypothetical protein [Kiritimatiellia bacterium]HPS07061.1 hypothetical protein [Kiritimatiellia bacterium]